MNIFVMVYNVKSVLYVYALVVFKICLLRKSNAKFLLASLKTLTNF
jgi:hypothetical protein